MNLGDLPHDLQTVLGAVERYARRKGFPAYLVGGAVRDALLGRRVLDVDVAVEGDALAVAREVANNLPIEVRIHAAFGTAALTSESGRRVDLAATRAERYEGVAALPTVRPASLEEDLLRRDFTVNSMALPLARWQLDGVIDPSGGRADLAAGRLRVHHRRSFLDDPTRILRGVRLEARLGLVFAPKTERWARAAITAGALAALSGERLHAELEQVMAEEVPAPAIWERLGDLGVCAAIGLGTGGEETAALLERARQAHAGWESRYGDAHAVSEPMLLVAALTLTRPPEERRVLAERLCVRLPHLMELDQLAADVSRPGVLPHTVAAALAPLADDELLLVAMLLGPERAVVVYDHLERQRRLELCIDGSMLLERGFAPGPAIGEALEATRAARLDGRLSADEELAFAVALLEGEGGG